jgi:D-glycero-D-manno-heptose 1,7-bisphosphate phosphatase
LAAQGALRGTVGQGYFRDIGVPDDYAAAEEELPRVLRRRALFLDRDGVLDVDHGYVGSRDRWDWVPGAREAVAEATARGWHVFVVTNQSGIARGKYAESDLAALHAWMADEIRAAGGTVDDIRHCPFHVDATVPAYRAVSDWRKPAPGMLLDLLRAWELDPARCVMVGDQATDVAAGEAAGMRAHRFPGGDLRAFLAPILE